MSIRLYPWQHKFWQQVAKNLSLMPHAIMLTGRAGTGKTEFALNLVQLVLCLSPHKKKEGLFPCGACRSCLLFASQTHPDFFLVGGEKTILLPDIHRLRQFLQLTAHLGSNKVAVLSQAEKMNQEAANALLKILEEPPASKFLFLVSSAEERIAATVRSRCVFMRMPTLNAKELANWLKSLSEPLQLDEFFGEFCANAPLATYELLTSERGKSLKQLNQSLDLFDKGEMTARHFSAQCFAAVNGKKAAVYPIDPLDLLIWRLEHIFVDKRITDSRLYGLRRLLLTRRRLLLENINLNKELLYEECALLWQAARRGTESQ